MVAEPFLKNIIDEAKTASVRFLLRYDNVMVKGACMRWRSPRRRNAPQEHTNGQYNIASSENRALIVFASFLV